MAEYEFIRGATGRILQVRVIPSADTARMRYNVIILKRRARLMRVLGASELAESIEEVLDSLAAYQGALGAMIRDERER